MRLQRGRSWSNMLLERERNANRAVAVDRSAWYMPRVELLSAEAAATFHLSHLDPATQQFIDDSTANSDAFCLQVYYSMATAILSVFFTKTSINGLLSRGGMFLFSEDHLRDFLQIPAEWTPNDKMVLDLGAGDGGVTEVLASLFSTVHTTEMSQIMQWRLRQRGFTVVDASSWHLSTHSYSLISALNLLDRHFSPRLLLSQLHSKSSKSGCDVLLSLVLPIRHYVEFRPTGSGARPEAYLEVSGNTLEEQAASLITGEFRSAGFQVLRWTKLPYLCEGDFFHPFYTLDDAIFLLRSLPSSVSQPPQKPSPSRTLPSTRAEL